MRIRNTRHPNFIPSILSKRTFMFSLFKQMIINQEKCFKAKNEKVSIQF